MRTSRIFDLIRCLTMAGQKSGLFHAGLPDTKILPDDEAAKEFIISYLLGAGEAVR